MRVASNTRLECAPPSHDIETILIIKHEKIARLFVYSRQTTDWIGDFHRDSIRGNNPIFNDGVA